MPRYFFHVDNGELIPDHTGVEFANLGAAKAEAVRACGEMLEDLQGGFWDSASPWNMHITDEDNRLQFTLMFSAKVPSGDVIFIPAQTEASVDPR